MNIVLASDNNFVQHCAVTMLSVLKHNKGVHFFLLTEGLSTENSSYLTELVFSHSGQLQIIEVPSEVVQKFPLPKTASAHISIATYYRLFITTLLGADIEKAIYLDCDMVILGGLEDLWNTDLSHYTIGAVYQNLGWSDYNQSWSRLNIPREEGYFNAGMLLLNLKCLREMNFEEKAIQYIKENYNRIISHDQDVLNSLLYDKTLPLSPKWNYLSLFLNRNIQKISFPDKFHFGIQELASPDFKPIVIHFVSQPKPWNYGCSNPYKKYYYETLQLTKWKDYKPQFKWKLYYTSVIYPKLVSFILKLDVFHLVPKRKNRQINQSSR